MPKTAVIIFPGSNCDRDIFVAMEQVFGTKVDRIWHADHTPLTGYDFIAVPGGFTYGDYLRCGAIAAQSPIMREVKEAADKGVLTFGVCNGFQILTEVGLLPGTLMRNRDIKFICKDVNLRVANNNTAFTSDYEQGQVVTIPVAHHDGNYFSDEDTLKSLEDNEQIAFQYASPEGDLTNEANPNGSLGNIAGIYNEKKNVLGMMPHPERVINAQTGGTDGVKLFSSVLAAIS